MISTQSVASKKPHFCNIAIDTAKGTCYMNVKGKEADLSPSFLHQ